MDGAAFNGGVYAISNSWLSSHSAMFGHLSASLAIIQAHDHLQAPVASSLVIITSLCNSHHQFGACVWVIWTPSHYLVGVQGSHSQDELSATTWRDERKGQCWVAACCDKCKFWCFSEKKIQYCVNQDPRYLNLNLSCVWKFATVLMQSQGNNNHYAEVVRLLIFNAVNKGVALTSLMMVVSGINHSK